MKAVQLAKHGDPEVLQVQEVPDPTPGPEDVLIEVKATTVNHLDLFQRAGTRPVPRMPFTPGLEAAGIVLQDANGFHKGEHVLTDNAVAAKGGGGYAGKIAAPASDLARIPAGVSFEQAVAAGLAASTAWASLFDLGHLKAGERVLIWAGSSGVGTFAIQLAKHAGAYVITTASNSERADALSQLGADRVINHREQDLGKMLQGAEGVHLVVELVGSTLEASIEASQHDGRIILVGNLGGQESTVNTQAWRLKRVHVIGGGLLHTTPQNMQQALQLVAEKVITPMIARTFPVEQAAEAHRLLASGEPQGKIVLIHS
ncbi:MAG: zinc-binding dehydrogenase [Ktedonobacteraceae bacterium]|nr:zinc-binding dehydrogenase [Ktedonobacteraceae bacterium]